MSFDPGQVYIQYTVPKLKEMLTKLGVEYPANRTKKFYITLLTETMQSKLAKSRELPAKQIDPRQDSTSPQKRARPRQPSPPAQRRSSRRPEPDVESGSDSESPQPRRSTARRESPRRKGSAPPAAKALKVGEGDDASRASRNPLPSPRMPRGIPSRASTVLSRRQTNVGRSERDNAINDDSDHDGSDNSDDTHQDDGSDDATSTSRASHSSTRRSVGSDKPVDPSMNPFQSRRASLLPHNTTLDRRSSSRQGEGREATTRGPGMAGFGKQRLRDRHEEDETHSPDDGDYADDSSHGDDDVDADVDADTGVFKTRTARLALTPGLADIRTSRRSLPSTRLKRAVPTPTSSRFRHSLYRDLDNDDDEASDDNNDDDEDDDLVRQVLHNRRQRPRDDLPRSHRHSLLLGRQSLGESLDHAASSSRTRDRSYRAQVPSRVIPAGIGKINDSVLDTARATAAATSAIAAAIPRGTGVSGSDSLNASFVFDDAPITYPYHPPAPTPRRSVTVSRLDDMDYHHEPLEVTPRGGMRPSSLLRPNSKSGPRLSPLPAPTVRPDEPFEDSSTESFSDDDMESDNDNRAAREANPFMANTQGEHHSDAHVYGRRSLGSLASPSSSSRYAIQGPSLSSLTRTKPAQLRQSTDSVDSVDIYSKSRLPVKRISYGSAYGERRAPDADVNPDEHFITSSAPPSRYSLSSRHLPRHSYNSVPPSRASVPPTHGSHTSRYTGTSDSDSDEDEYEDDHVAHREHIPGAKHGFNAPVVPVAAKKPLSNKADTAPSPSPSRSSLVARALGGIRARCPPLTPSQKGPLLVILVSAVVLIAALLWSYHHIYTEHAPSHVVYCNSQQYPPVFTTASLFAISTMLYPSLTLDEFQSRFENITQQSPIPSNDMTPNWLESPRLPSVSATMHMLEDIALLEYEQSHNITLTPADRTKLRFSNRYCTQCPPLAFCHGGKQYCPAPFSSNVFQPTPPQRQRQLGGLHSDGSWASSSISQRLSLHSPLSLGTYQSAPRTTAYPASMYSQAECSDQFFLSSVTGLIHRNAGIYDCFFIDVSWIHSALSLLTTANESNALCHALNYLPFVDQDCSDHVRIYNSNKTLYYANLVVSTLYSLVVRPIAFVLQLLVSVIVPSPASGDPSKAALQPVTRSLNDLQLTKVIAHKYAIDFTTAFLAVQYFQRSILANIVQSRSHDEYLAAVANPTSTGSNVHYHLAPAVLSLAAVTADSYDYEANKSGKVPSHGDYQLEITPFDLAHSTQSSTVVYFNEEDVFTSPTGGSSRHQNAAPVAPPGKSFLHIYSLFYDKFTQSYRTAAPEVRYADNSYSPSGSSTPKQASPTSALSTVPSVFRFIPATYHSTSPIYTWHCYLYSHLFNPVFYVVAAALFWLSSIAYNRWQEYNEMQREEQIEQLQHTLFHQIKRRLIQARMAAAKQYYTRQNASHPSTWNLNLQNKAIHHHAALCIAYLEDEIMQDDPEVKALGLSAKQKADVWGEVYYAVGKERRVSSFNRASDNLLSWCWTGDIPPEYLNDGMAAEPLQAHGVHHPQTAQDQSTEPSEPHHPQEDLQNMAIHS